MNVGSRVNHSLLGNGTVLGFTRMSVVNRDIGVIATVRGAYIAWDDVHVGSLGDAPVAEYELTELQ